MLWITKSEIARHREISRAVRDEKINPIIEDAQFLDIRPLLTSKLYDALDSENDYTGKSERFKKLMKGGSYEYKGRTYFNPGLSKVMSIYVYSRYVLLGSFTDTSFGFVQKKSQDSESVSDAQKRNVHKMELQSAASYFSEVANFLDRNLDTYPEWRSNSCGKRANTGRIKISKIN